MGPSLSGLDGRTAASISGFNFSAALRDRAIVWNASTLDAFLANPQAFVPGTVMPFGGIRNATQRSALICYLLLRGS
jgi:cytochrome c